MVNEFSNSHSNVITMNGETLEIVDKLKYLGSTLVKIRLVTENSALVNLSTI